MRLLSFSVSNYKSFLAEQTITFDSDSKVDILVGPNGSGKSNLLKAMHFYRKFIRTSTTYKAKDTGYEPFLFNIEADKLPTEFKAEMQTDKSVYYYAFSIQNGLIKSEILKRKKTNSDSAYDTIFSRSSIDKKRYEDNGFGSQILKSTRDDALILTKAWENNNKYALEVFAWLDHLKFIAGSQHAGLTAEKVKDSQKFKAEVLRLLQKADLYIQDLSVNEVEIPEVVINAFSDEVKAKVSKTSYDVTTTHMVYDAKGNIVKASPLPLSSESTGTKRIFELAFPILDSLENGNTLCIDEFEVNLHPKECTFLVGLFRSPSNKKGARLVITTHNTQLLDQVGRDSVHLVGKNAHEETILGQISKNIRTDDKLLEKKYNKGLFGANPNIRW